MEAKHERAISFATIEEAIEFTRQLAAIDGIRIDELDERLAPSAPAGLIR